MPETTSAIMAALRLSATLLLVACKDGTPTSSDNQPTLPEFPLGAEQPIDRTINTSDTYVIFDATREQRMSITVSDPVYDANTEQPITALNLDAPAQVLFVEAGYNSWGQVRYNEYRQPSGLNPYSVPVDETEQIQIAGDQVTAYGPDGAIPVEQESGTDSPYPLEELGSTAYAQITDGVVLADNPSNLYNLRPSSAQDGGTRVERIGSQLRITTTFSADNGAGAAGMPRHAAIAAGKSVDGKVVRNYAK